MMHRSIVLDLRILIITPYINMTVMKLKSFACYVLLFLCTLAGSRAQTAIAPEGAGTKSNPFQIASLENLYWISQNPDQWAESNYYIQTANIDALGTANWFPNGSGGYYGFPCIGGYSQAVGNQQSGTFAGTYDGQGFYIYGLYINRGPEYVGFFGFTSNATIKNLTLRSPWVIVNKVTGAVNTWQGSALLVANGSVNLSFVRIRNGIFTNNGIHAYIGGMLGRMQAVTAKDCSVDAVVNSTSDNLGQTGMFIGYSESNTGVFTKCSASGAFSMNRNGQAGGFFGAVANGNYTFSNCFSTVSLNAGSAAVGGFAGTIFGNGTTISNCYSTGTVTGSPVGGFIGNASGTAGSRVTNCYSTGRVNSASGGGFIGGGATNITFSGCAFDMTTSAKTTGANGSTPAGITGRATAAMKVQANFTGWDFMGETTNGTNDYWFINASANNGYPSLKGRIREWAGSAGNAWETSAHWLYGIIPDENSIVLLKATTYVPIPNGNKTVDMISFEGVNLIWQWGNYDLTCNQVLGSGAAAHLRFNGTGKLNINVPDGEPRIFPAGLAAYTPLTITNKTGAADLFSVKVYDEVFKNGGSSGDIVAEARIRHTWNISKANPNAGTGIDLSFRWPGTSTYGEMTEPALFHFEDGKWRQQNSGSTSSSITSFTYNNYTGSFSPFAIADKAALVLPLQWGIFTATKEKNASSLKWTTGSETDTKDFLVQHSTNQSSWNTIGTVPAAGNSTKTQQYSFTHTKPASGINYYRLLQRDINNNSSLSKTVSLRFDHSTASISIYPNPVTNGKITVSSTQPGSAQIYNSNGVMVLQKNINAGTQELNLFLPAGMYYFRSGEHSIPFLIR
ncbi:T9SS type A sorting domain-containing protein [Pseudobacter ginsenosidimutans]|nr:T9SS type A sorting domain-containing protein [Pseudobacter ginsenosidimutans]